MPGIETKEPLEALPNTTVESSVPCHFSDCTQRAFPLNSASLLTIEWE